MHNSANTLRSGHSVFAKLAPLAMVAVTLTLPRERIWEAFARPRHYPGEPRVFQVVESDAVSRVRESL